MNYILRNILANEDIEAIKLKGYSHVGFSNSKVSYSFFEDTEKYNLYELYKNNPMEILIIHGNEDDTAPIEHSIKFANIHPKLAQLEIFGGTEHLFKKDGELERLIEISTKYFNEHLN